MTRRQLMARRAVLLTWSLLFVLVCLHQLQMALTLRQLLWALFFSLPLLICLPGLARGNRHTHKWATLCVLPYFVVGVTEGVANPSVRTWALTMLGASLLWFFALVANLRVSRPDIAPHNQPSN